MQGCQEVYRSRRLSSQNKWPAKGTELTLKAQEIIFIFKCSECHFQYTPGYFLSKLTENSEGIIVMCLTGDRHYISYLLSHFEILLVCVHEALAILKLHSNLHYIPNKPFMLLQFSEDGSYSRYILLKTPSVRKC